MKAFNGRLILSQTVREHLKKVHLQVRRLNGGYDLTQKNQTTRLHGCVLRFRKMCKTDVAADRTTYDSEVHCIHKVTFFREISDRRGNILFF